MTTLDNLMNKVHCMDALELMALLPEQSVDAIITDLPYGTTACSWDEIIPFAPMWAGVRRILKPRGVFVTTASQPFTSKLVMSNLEMFRYEWIWVKSKATGFLDANRKPMKNHENVLVFSEGRALYFPQMIYGADPYVTGKNGRSENYGKFEGVRTINLEGTRYPKSVMEFTTTNGLHPTQKPVALYEYLIRTYTQPGELVLDFCAGSGTTGVAAQKLNRRWIMNDSSPEYAAVADKRVSMPYAVNMFETVGAE